MPMPTMAEICRFIFNHTEWLEGERKKWEVAEFIAMVDFIANRHHIQDIPVVADLKRQAGELVDAGVKWDCYDGLDVSLLVTDDHEGHVRICESPFGRIIPLEQLFDWVVDGRGDVVRIEVGIRGMTVTTSSGNTVKLPGCELSLDRLGEDGRRYRLACVLIKHVTGGKIALNHDDLIGKTQNVSLRVVGDEWVADTSVPVP